MNQDFFGFPTGAWTKPQVYVFQQSVKFGWPSSATHISILVIGGGGGGGGGRKGSATTAYGGGGGCGGFVRYVRRIPFELITTSGLSPNMNIVIGAGGTAGSGATTDGSNGGNGGIAGASYVEFFVRRVSGTTENLQQGIYFIYAQGGGAGLGGTSAASSSTQATVQAASAGAFRGLTGGTSSSGFGGQVIGSYDTNLFGTHPFIFTSPAGGACGGVKDQIYSNNAITSAILHTSGLHWDGSAENGIDIQNKFGRLTDNAPFQYLQAPYLEDLSWWITLPGGGGGAGGDATTGGKFGGAGYCGSGGGGGGATGSTTLNAGAGGVGGRGRVIIWAEKLW